MDDRATVPWTLRTERGLQNLLLLVLVGLIAGCSSIGPGSVTRDRFDYTQAVADAWQQEMLLNIVKIRYSDTPVFLSMGQIVSGYTMQSTFSAMGNILTNQGYLPGTQTGTIGLAAQGQFTDRPTITYTPLQGESFAHSFMAPIPPPAILSLIQSGAPVDLTMRLTVNEVNGLRNHLGGDFNARQGDPDFYLLLERLNRLQLAGGISMQVRRISKEDATMFTFPRKTDPSIEADTRVVRQMLGLDPGIEEVRIVYGSVAADDKEIAILSRSILQVLVELSSYITVPEAHVADGLVGPTREPDVAPSGGDCVAVHPQRGYRYDNRRMGRI